MNKVANRPAAAAISMLSAMTIIGFIDNYVGVIAEHVGLWQFHVMRSLMMAPCLVLFAVLGFGRLTPIRWRPVMARSTVITISMMLYFGALGLMPISQALAGLFTSPIFVVLINTFVFSQRIGPWRVGAVLLGFCGILLVLQPFSQGFGPHMAMPVAAGFFYAIAAIATRRWCEGESAVALLTSNMVFLGVVGAIMSVVFSIMAVGETGFLTRGWTWEVAGALPWVALQAVGSAVAVLMIIRAYQLDEPSNVAVFEYAVMISAPLFAWVLFAETLGWLQALGIAMIALAGIIIAVRSRD